MIYLIDQIKQKNDGDFILVDAADVGYGDERLDDYLGTLALSIGDIEYATDEEVEEMLTEIFG